MCADVLTSSVSNELELQKLQIWMEVMTLQNKVDDPPTHPPVVMNECNDLELNQVQTQAQLVWSTNVNKYTHTHTRGYSTHMHVCVKWRESLESALLTD